MKAVPASRYIVFAIIAFGGLYADLSTKSAMFRWLGMPGQPGSTHWVVPQVFAFQTSLNEGALFGLGLGMAKVFALLSVAAALAILWWLFVAGAAKQWLLTVALGGIMAGILGNLYDRIGMPGLIWNYPNSLHKDGDPVFAVRDWILVMFGNWPWPNFNVADSLLVCGAALLVYQAFVQGDAKATGSNALQS